MSAAAIAVRGIGKHFGELKVLDDVGFEVGEGETVALLGTSGCGKSTLLNIVAGLAVPDAGELWLHGERAAARGERRSLAYMFQEDRLLPWRTVQANAELALEAAQPRLSAHGRRERAAAALEMVGLAAFAGHHPHQLSGGMRSRVALARSLIGEPGILLMDEPFSKLDPQTRAQMHGEVLRLRALRPTTILFVTHDVEEAIVLADRVIVLAPRPGRVREIVNVSLPRPRSATETDVAEAVRRLRLLV
ncbi:ABC transporter ATP-binding protein [Paraburkholderia sp. JHI869]|uniref:ABC transporter ATP-binding protein n=1 Tax=Paraburkholderia sp. JHI869 TaxID=3112959 RepID=UPI00317A9EDC